jgi:alanine dehydrogenase
MIIGVPKEIKDHETRVGLVPSGVTALREAGHEVLVETHAGEGSSLTDQEYAEAGASILATAGEVWQRADLIVKVKEPQTAEYGFFRADLILFTYLHLAPLPELTDKLVDAKVNGVAYETIREHDGSLPLLTPMSEVAGRMSVQVGAQYLERPSGGRGILLGGVPGVAPGNVVILGGGIVGTNAAKIAIGMGAHVAIIDRSLNRLRELDDISTERWSPSRRTRGPSANLKTADRGGAVLIPVLQRLVRREMISRMKRGAVVVDIAIDQAAAWDPAPPRAPGPSISSMACSTVRLNMPARRAHTSTLPLTNATFPYPARTGEPRTGGACQRHAALREGVNTYKGFVTYKGVGESQGREWRVMASVE